MSKLKPNKQIESPLNGRQPSCKCQNIWHRSSFVIRRRRRRWQARIRFWRWPPALIIFVSQKFKHSQEDTHFLIRACAWAFLKHSCVHFVCISNVILCKFSPFLSRLLFSRLCSSSFRQILSESFIFGKNPTQEGQTPTAMGTFFEHVFRSLYYCCLHIRAAFDHI